jgi:hypothetical protein
MMLSDSGVVVTIDFGTTSLYNSACSGTTNRFGMDADLVTLEYDLGCLASSLLLLVDHNISNLHRRDVQEAYNCSYM